jgi:hypothetical protein
MDEPDFPQWPHTEQVYNHPTFWLENPWVTVTEKIHGFNTRTGLTPNGLFWVGSRNNVIHKGLDTPITEPLQGFTEYAISMEEGMVNGYTYFGEWAGPGIQKGIDYGKEKRFFLFAIMRWEPSSGRNNLLPWSDIERHADLLGCELVPLLFEGRHANIGKDEILSWAIGPSAVSPDEGEGIVIAAWPPAVDEYGHLVMLKTKNPKFAERTHERRPAQPKPDLTNVQAFVDDYATAERLTHILQQIEETTAANPLHPQHTGLVLRTYYEDIIREGATDYAALSESDQKLVGKVVNIAVKPLLEAARNEPSNRSR